MFPDDALAQSGIKRIVWSYVEGHDLDGAVSALLLVAVSLFFVGGLIRLESLAITLLVALVFCLSVIIPAKRSASRDRRARAFPGLSDV